MRWYLLGILVVLNLSNFVNRHLPFFLLEPIRLEMGLSDAQIGALLGVTFTICYCLFAFPIAWLADNWNRARVVAAAASLWGLSSALCGMANSAFLLGVARLGVGIGQSGFIPAANSLLIDYFPKHQHNRATSILSAAWPLATIVAGIGGTALAAVAGWRVALIAFGLPTVLVAILLLVTIRSRHVSRATPPINDENPASALSTFAQLKALMGIPTFIYLSLASAITAFSGVAQHSWNPTFYVRSHGLDLVEVGVTLGLVAGIGGLIGILGAGFVIDHLVKRGLKWAMMVPAVALLFQFPFTFCVYWVDSTIWSLVLVAVPSTLTAIFLAPCLAVIPGLVDSKIRSMATAIYLIIVNIGGLGLAPFMTGMISEFFADWAGQESLRYALLCLILFVLPASWCFYKASTTIVADSR